MTPKANGLTRDLIVSEALNLLDDEGVDAFSMRKLGAALNVDPMAIYHHVANKAQLFDAIVDTVWTRIPLPNNDNQHTWQEEVIDLFNHLRRILQRHPNIVPLIATRPMVSRDLLDFANAVLGHLNTRGLPPHEAMKLIDCAVGYTVGKMAGEVCKPVGGPSRTPEQVIATITPDTHPHIMAALANGYGWQPDEEFDSGLRALIYGWPTQRVDQ